MKSFSQMCQHSASNNSLLLCRSFCLLCPALPDPQQNKLAAAGRPWRPPWEPQIVPSAAACRKRAALPAGAGSTEMAFCPFTFFHLQDLQLSRRRFPDTVGSTDTAQTALSPLHHQCYSYHLGSGYSWIRNGILSCFFQFSQHRHDCDFILLPRASSSVQPHVYSVQLFVSL